MAQAPKFIGSDIYRLSRYGGKHPLAIPRVSLVIDMARALGWLDATNYIDSPIATPAQLARFHAHDYIAAVQMCEQRQAVTEEQRARYGLGAGGNPVFGEIFSRPATACGATIHATELLTAGGTIFSPAGGTHHGQASRASGFCYFNDPVLGLLSFLDQGLSRIAYIDIDAHHCDGVEMALGDDPRVMLVSIHERDRWPFTGLSSSAAANIWNFPVPKGFHDSDFDLIWEQAVLPLVTDFAPQAILLQAGADALADDPLSKLSLSNNAHIDAVTSLKGLSPRFLVVGGGGYNPYTVSRCWTALWAVLSGQDMPDPLPADAAAFLHAVSWRHSLGRNPKAEWFDSLRDERNAGPISADVRDLVRQINHARRASA